MLAAVPSRQPEGRPPKRLRSIKQAFAGEFNRQRALTGKLTWESLAVYADDPVGFCRDVIGAQQWDKQDEILEAVRDYDRVSVRAGQKVSKSFAASILALWWLCTRPRSKVVFTAPTSKQVRMTLYGQMLEFVDAIRRRHPGLLDSVRVALLPETGMQSDDFRTIVGVTAHDDGSIAGLGGKDTLWILDESSHIKESIYQAVEGNCASGGCKILAISNPRLTHGWFFSTHNRNREFWHTIHLAATDSINYRERREVIKGLAPYEYVEQRRIEWGEDSWSFQVLVLGNFALSDESKMFPSDRVRDSIDLWDETPADGPLRIGLDPAGASARADEIIAAFVRGRKLLALQSTRSLDAEQLIDWLVKATRVWRQASEVPELRIDVEGAVGAQVLGTVRAYEKNNPGTFKIVAISSSDAARKNKKAFATVRDELADSLEQWCKTGALLDDPLLLEDLSVMEWFTDNKGRNKLIAKSDLKSALGRSPDRYDALALACYESGSQAQRAAIAAQVARKQAEAPRRTGADRQWTRPKEKSARAWHGR